MCIRRRKGCGENTELKKLLADQMLKSKALEIALEKNSERGAAAKVQIGLSCSGRTVCRWLGTLHWDSVPEAGQDFA